MPDRTGESMRTVDWMRQTLISQLATITGVVMLSGGLDELSGGWRGALNLRGDSERACPHSILRMESKHVLFESYPLMPALAMIVATEPAITCASLNPL
jgi:hypothetical protein